MARAAKPGPVLTCKGKGVQATGLEASQGFGVCAGSQTVVDSAPSTAAAVVLGHSANGRLEWKAADGRTLEEIQKAEAGQ